MLTFENFMYFFIIGISYLYLSKDYEYFLYKFFESLLSFFKFKIQIKPELIENFPSKLILVSSHTSIHDFFICYFIYYIFFRKRYNITVIMKKTFQEITMPIISKLDNKIDIIKVDNKQKGTTQQIIDHLKHKDNYLLAIAPEGTRRCVNDIKSGYYYIGKELDCKILYIGVDFNKRTIELEPIHELEDEWINEKNWFIQNCKKYSPLFPERCFWTREEFLESFIDNNIDDNIDKNIVDNIDKNN